MNLTQVKNNIMNRTLAPVYIFTGDEIGVMDIYIQQMAKATKKQVVRADTFKNVFPNLTGRDMLSQGQCIYVIRDDKKVLETEKVWEIIQGADWEDVVVLIYTSLDKRTSFYKKHTDLICEFGCLDDAVLTKYIQKEIPLSQVNCERLIKVCESSYSRIMLEVDKIKQYLQSVDPTGDDLTWDQGFQRLLKDGTIYQPASDSIFEWCDAVMCRDCSVAFDFMDVCFRSGEASLTMLSVLYTNMKHTLQVQAHKGADITKSTGLTGWQVQCVKKFTGKYTISELIRGMSIIREMEVGIKTGKIEDTMVIPYVLVNLF